MIAEAKFYREVRKFAVTVKIWQTAIRYTVKQDEMRDITLIARRVYGTSDEYMTVMAAAGLDRLNSVLTEGMSIILPTKEQLQAFKNACGIQSNKIRSVR